jgi:cytochrome c556
MKTCMLAVLIVLGGLTAQTAGSSEPADGTPAQALALSPDLLELLRGEMREITAGMQRLLVSLATADWQSITDTAGKIRASYILEQELDAAQAEKLEEALPIPFRQLDAEFHRRAGRLAEAAQAHDAELVAFHYSRLVESCSRCHAEFARQRFSGFAAPAAAGHHH